MIIYLAEIYWVSTFYIFFFLISRISFVLVHLSEIALLVEIVHSNKVPFESCLNFPLNSMLSFAWCSMIFCWHLHKLYHFFIDIISFVVRDSQIILLNQLITWPIILVSVIFLLASQLLSSSFVGFSAP